MSDSNNKKNPNRRSPDKVQKPKTPKPETQGVEGANQQHAAPDSMAAEPTAAAGEVLAADQQILQQAIANPRTLSPGNAASIQRTVGNRKAQMMIAQAVERRQESGDADDSEVERLNIELEHILQQNMPADDDLDRPAEEASGGEPEAAPESGAGLSAGQIGKGDDWPQPTTSADEAALSNRELSQLVQLGEAAPVGQQKSQRKSSVNKPEDEEETELVETISKRDTE